MSPEDNKALVCRFYEEVFECLAATVDIASVQSEVNSFVELLEQATYSRWFRWLFIRSSRE